MHVYTMNLAIFYGNRGLFREATATITPPPTGTFEIRAKARNQTLIGADTDKDGEPDYKSHVDYWMPFVGNMVGLHDAPWRSSFGGSIYKTNGSHGCVNLPPSKAAELFSLVHVGDSVVVHW